MIYNTAILQKVYISKVWRPVIVSLWNESGVANITLSSVQVFQELTLHPRPGLFAWKEVC